MKIAFFHELPFGGARRAVNELAKQLKKEHIVDVYYVDKISQKDILQYFSNEYLYQFVEKNWTRKDWKTRIYKDTFELFKLFKLHKKIAQDINNKQYDFISVHPSKFTQAPFILRLLKAPVFYYCQEPLRIVYDSHVSAFKNIPLKSRFYEVLNRTLRKYIDVYNIWNIQYIMVNSYFSQKNVKKAYNRNSDICYLGVDAQMFKPLNLSKEYEILFIGALSFIEGYDLLTEVLTLFQSKVKVKIIAQNNTKISDKELVEEYNKAKIVIALSRNEPFGLIPIEAMACAVPVIAVKEGGFLESVIDGETGILITRDPQKLYYALKKLLDNDNLRNSLGKKAREIVCQKWTWEKSASRFLEIVEKCLIIK